MIFQGEGELWLGGIASIVVMLITAMAYNFAISYLNQYPAEKVGPSSFACDETIRNAKFDSSLEALAVPVSDIERPMFDVLNKQTFTLHLDLINTAASCAVVSIVEVIESSTYALPNVSCEATNGIVLVRAALSQHKITVRAILNDIQPAGGMRVGLSGPEQKTKLHTLHELNFSRVFVSDAAKTLAQQPTIQLELTKVSCSCYSMHNLSYTYCRSSTRLSHWDRVIPSSEASGCRHLRSACTRCSSMLLVMSPLRI